ncbi:MAG: DUF3623 family protein [Pseudomonadota bacterium]
MVYFWPTVFALALWWSSTVILLKRIKMPDSHRGGTLTAAWMILLVGVVLFGFSLTLATPLGACMAFAGALAIWCWHEAVYLLGYLTGPRPLACPPDASGSERFRYGIAASLYHELAVLLTVGLLWWWSAGADNALGAKVLTALWLLRWSTKINIFFGVANLHTEFWPERLRYLESYVGQQPNRSAMLVSGLLITLLAVWAVVSGGAADGLAAPGYSATATALLLALIILGALEHVLLALRVKDEWLWSLAVEPTTEAAPISVRASLATDGKLPNIKNQKPTGKT